MKIMFTSDLTGLGGGEIGLFFLAQEIVKQNECLVVCKQDGKLVDKLNEHRIPVVVFDYKNKKSPRNILTLRTIIKRFAPDAIISNDHKTSIIMKVASVGLGIKNYWFVHGQWYKFGLLKRFVLEKANNCMICVSKVVERNLKDQNFSKVLTLGLGIPVEKYQHAPNSSIRKEFGISTSTALIITVARFQEIKGQDLGVDLAYLLRMANYDFAYIFVGDCVFNNPQDEQYKMEVMEKVQHRGLSDTVLFAGERGDVASIMQEADILVIPSRNESLSVVALEAIASGLPIVSTPNDGVRGIFDDDLSFIAKEASPEGLFELVSKQLSSDDLKEHIQKKYSHLRDWYAVGNIVDQMLVVIQRT